MVLKVEGRRKHFSVGQAKYMQWRLYRGCEIIPYYKHWSGGRWVGPSAAPGYWQVQIVKCFPRLKLLQYPATDRILKAQSVIGRD